ncbi:MAG: Coenzyme F420 hydrogenase/dehydrogenase, beta subunit C-terminal domain [Candidatus Aminicenantes bacterium]|nr:Coenzyme F420 hydrogenase/dehydrogenase, beta subunit C-terminal domain [Candidatus Aminicenantes bacterium]
MPKALKMDVEASQGVKNFLKHLLESGKVKGVFALKKMNDSGAVSYSLITSVEELASAEPLMPLMPENAGQALSRLTVKEALKEPVAAVLRPCELRAFTELVKRVQGSEDNLLLISPICAGVFPLSSATDGSWEKQMASYAESSREGKIHPGVRKMCQACTSFIPGRADITVAFAGRKDTGSSCHLILDTPRGEEFAQGAPGTPETVEKEPAELAPLREARAARRSEVFKEIDVQGQKGLIKTFAPCLGCHGCMHVCPICHCVLCVFDSKMYELQPWSIESEPESKGGIRVPSGTLFFHLGRMAHMAVSCVNCGMCSDVCPVNIPVSEVFSMVGDQLQKVFEYVPGRDVEESVPSGTYKEDEFAGIGEQ